MDWTAILISGVVGGFVMFLWYGIAWMAIGHHSRDFKKLPNRSAVEDCLRSVPVEDAFYMLPHLDEFEGGMKDPELDQRMREGPNAMIVRLAPGPAAKLSVFYRGLGLNLVEGLCCAVLAGLLGATLAGFGERVLFFAGFGLFCGFSVYGGLCNWLTLPRRFSVLSTIDRTIAYALLGVVLHLLGPSGTSPA